MSLRIEARGKINLALAVTGCRDDGYHLLDTVMASMDIADTLWMTKTGGITLKVEGDAPSDERNLALRAVRLLEPLSRGQGVSITLKKQIPSMAGLGGGSADAAAVLLGLNRLWDLRLSAEDLRLQAVKLGADVPFMLHGGLARCRGIGEDIAPLEFHGSLPLLIIKGEGGLSTADVYRTFDAVAHSRTAIDMDGALRALEGLDMQALSRCLANALEAPARILGLPVEAALHDLMDSGALTAHMTGSGAAFFGIFPDGDTAERARERLVGRYPYCRTAATCSSGPIFAEGPED